MANAWFGRMVDRALCAWRGSLKMPQCGEGLTQEAARLARDLMRFCFSACRVRCLLLLVSMLGCPLADTAAAADKPRCPRPALPVLLPESEPAGVVVSVPQPFTEGWEQIARMPEPPTNEQVEQLLGEGAASSAK